MEEKTTLIAEAGNCHFGNLDTAKQMIHIAKECGADLVKFQAIEPDYVAKFGSMPTEFYHHVAFTFDEYLELIEAGAKLGIPVFYSAFGPEIKKIFAHTFYHKISAKQSPTWEFTEWMDKASTFVSVNPDFGRPPMLDNVNYLYATPYLPQYVDFENLEALSIEYETVIGYSDHTIGIEHCLEAHRCGAHVIEKHFTLSRDFNWDGMAFRDTVNSATPNELEQLARRIK